MPVILFLSLTLHTVSAFAMGDPSVVLTTGTEIVVFVASLCYVLISRATLASKVVAVCFLLGAGAAATILSNMPDYASNHLWIDALSALCVFMGIFGAIRALKKP